MNKIKNAFYALTALAVLAPSVVSAQVDVTKGMGTSNLSGKSVGTILTTVLNYLLLFVGVLGVIGFVVSGIMYITAAGDEDQIEKAKKVMLYSIIGVIVALIGYVVITALSGVFVDNKATF